MPPSCLAAGNGPRAGGWAITYRGPMDPLAPDARADNLAALRNEITAGGAPRYHESNLAKGKLFARKRIDYLVDPGSFVEDGQLANALAAGLPADGVVTGIADIGGPPRAPVGPDLTGKR